MTCKQACGLHSSLGNAHDTLLLSASPVCLSRKLQSKTFSATPELIYFGENEMALFDPPFFFQNISDGRHEVRSSVSLFPSLPPLAQETPSILRVCEFRVYFF
jgi:hypothetical protein